MNYLLIYIYLAVYELRTHEPYLECQLSRRQMLQQCVSGLVVAFAPGINIKGVKGREENILG